MNYILICEIPFPSKLPPGLALHTRRLNRDQVIAAIRSRWTDIDQTLALLDACSPQEGAGRRHFAVPVKLMAGPHTLHVEGKMDHEYSRYRFPCLRCQAQGKGCAHRLPLEWVAADHVCSPRCYIPGYARSSKTHFAVK